jgi:hypothetical protein
MTAMSRVGALILLGLLTAVLLGTPSVWARDRGVDGHFTHRRSSHFVLYQDVAIDRYSGPFGSRQFERDVLEVLEESFDRVVGVLGVRPLRPVEVVVYDPAVFDGQFAGLFGFRAAGFYHGVIRIRGGTRISTELVRTLHHEYVHAALDGAAPGVTLPAWLNEGLAEYFEALALGKRRLSAGEITVLGEGRRREALPSLAAMSGATFAPLAPEQASLAYLKSYALIEHLVRGYGEAGLRRFVAHVLRTGNVERAAERAFRRSPAELESALHGDLQ